MAGAHVSCHFLLGLHRVPPYAVPMNCTRFCPLPVILLLCILSRPAAAENYFSPEQLLDFACLDAAYPGLFSGIEKNTDTRILLETPHGMLLYDDGIPKNPQERIADADIQDSMAEPYPLEDSAPQKLLQARPLPGKDSNPGRARSYPLLNALYGTDQARRARNTTLSLQRQNWICSRDMLRAANKVRDEIEALIAARPEFAPYFTPFSSYSPRHIAGTRQFSPHAYGIAVDCNPDKAGYWRWTPNKTHPSQQGYPTEIVRIFEKHGFIWGGKWYHFDTMHFEYRPEIIAKARALQKKRNP